MTSRQTWIASGTRRKTIFVSNSSARLLRIGRQRGVGVYCGVRSWLRDLAVYGISIHLYGIITVTSK